MLYTYGGFCVVKLLALDVGLTISGRNVRLGNKQNKNYDGDDIRDHRDELSGNYRTRSKNDLEACTHAEEQTCYHSAMGSELAEDNGCKCDEALTNDRCRSKLVHGGHGNASAAETCHKSGYNYAGKTHLDNIDTKGITSVGVFAAGTESKTKPGLVEYKPYDDNNEKYEISRRVVCKNILKEVAPGRTAGENIGEKSGKLGIGKCGRVGRVKQRLCS